MYGHQGKGSNLKAFANGTLLTSCVLCVAVLLVYSNSFEAGFPLDNRGLILDDSRVHAVTAQNLDGIFGHTYWWPVGESGLYRPFTTLTFLFNYAVLGDGEHPAGYHCLNLVLHCGNVLLVWALVRRLWGVDWRATWVAALWAVHPVLTESVTNIVGRADLLAGMAILGGLWMHIRSREAVGRERALWLAGLLAVTTAGVFSKESAVTVAGVILLYEASCADARGRREAILRSMAVVLLPIALMLYQRWAVLSRSAPTNFPFTDNPIVGAGFWSGRLTAVKVMGKYAALLFWPVSLSSDYSYAQIPALTGASMWIAAAAAGAGLAAVAQLWRWSRTGFFVAASALLVFLPGSNLLFPIGTIMAERFLYLPSIAFAAGVVWAAYTMADRAGWQKTAPVILGAVVVVLGIRTFVRNQDWRDELTLAQAAVGVSPASFKTHKMLTNALLESDQSHGNIELVIDEAERSLAILDSLPADRNNADTYQRAGGYYFMKGDRLRTHNADGSYAATPESAAAYRRALALLERSEEIVKASGQSAPNPGRDADLAAQMAKLYLRVGEPQKAMEAAVRARAMDPENADVHRLIVGLLVDGGRDDDAVVALMEGVLVTRDADLRQKLIDLYRGGLDTQGCAITPQGALNSRCPTVQRQLCRAAAEVVKLRTETNRPDLAAEMTKTAAREFGCEPGMR